MREEGVCLFVCFSMSVCWFVYLFVCLPVGLFVSLFLFLFVCLMVCLFIYLSSVCLLVWRQSWTGDEGSVIRRKVAGGKFTGNYG